MTAYAPAAARDIPALAALWQTCFGDPASDSEPILTHPQIRTFAAYAGGKPVSMLCALPATLVDEAGGALRLSLRRLHRPCVPAARPEQRPAGLLRGGAALRRLLLRGARSRERKSVRILSKKRVSDRFLSKKI